MAKWSKRRKGEKRSFLLFQSHLPLEVDLAVSHKVNCSLQIPQSEENAINVAKNRLILSITTFQFTMGVASLFYNGLTKRTSTFALSIVVTTLIFERAYDGWADWYFERHNNGKLWKDLKHKYDKED